MLPTCSHEDTFAASVRFTDLAESLGGEVTPAQPALLAGKLGHMWAWEGHVEGAQHLMES